MNYNMFQRPQRYIGNEWNVIRKSHVDRVKICVGYPDLYEIGMSNLGLRILYGQLNSFFDVVCERVFMPGDDYRQFISAEGARLCSLESKTPLSLFDVVGFNFNYELNYTNFLDMLVLGGITLEKNHRKHTIVMGGGIGNPEPIAHFVDVFFLGEFEESAVLFVDILKRYPDRESRLKALSECEGFYVPEFYNVSMVGDRYIFEKIYPHACFPLKRVHVKNFDKSFYPTTWLTPHMQIVHDRIPLEIARGCPNCCTFCQARALYSPYREREVDTISRTLRNMYTQSGYETFSLLSLSASNYSSIEALIDELLPYCESYKIGLSLPSLRVDDVIGRLYEKLISLKKTSLTLAVEAAEEGLRNKLNKRIDIKKLFEAADILRAGKMRSMKMYFMFGFPEESEDDLVAIGSFVERLRLKTRMALSVSVNIFIPKPFSLWESVSMATEPILQAKRNIIARAITQRRSIEVAMASVHKSLLEAIVSRADRNFAAVIERAYRKGALFAGDGQRFSWATWEAAMREEGIDYHRYLQPITTNFPWSFII